LPVAPSAIAALGELSTPSGKKPFPTPRALETDEIRDVVEQFRQAIANALEAGFDGVEIHAANGFLVDQFLRDSANRRTDRYGGSVENRARFLTEIVDQAIAIFGAGGVGVRLSPHAVGDGLDDSNPQALYGHVAHALEARGIAYLHLIEPDAVDRADRLAPPLRTIFTGPLILAGEFDRQSAMRAVAEGRADFVAFGRLYIANPDLAARFRLGAALNPQDVSTFFDGGEIVAVDRAQQLLELIVGAPASYAVILAARVAVLALLGLVGFFEGWFIAGAVFHVRVTIAHPGVLLATLLATVLAATGAALLFTALLGLARTTRTFQHAVNGPFYLLGGVLVPVSYLPAWLHPLAPLTFFYWAANLVRAALRPQPVDHLALRLAAIVGLGLLTGLAAMGR
jgi:hypothetical protein